MKVLNDKKLATSLTLTRESASLIRQGLEKLPEEKKTTVVFKKLIKNLDIVLVLWDRTIKNEVIIQEERRKLSLRKSKKVGLLHKQPDLTPTPEKGPH